MKSYSNKSAHEFNGYKFNDCDVCLNPKIAFELKTKNGSVTIEVAECEKGFFCGHHWDVKDIGGGCLPCSSICGIYSSEREAMYSELGSVVEYLEDIWYDGCKEFAEDIRKEREKKSVTQLSLF